MATYAGPTQVDIQPDEDMMSAHLENWFGACMEGEIDIGWIDPKTGVLNKFKRFDVGDFDLAAAFAAEINVTPGASVYYRPAVIPKSAPVFVRDEHAQFVPGVWADLDNEGAAEAVKNVCPPDCKPTTAVITGRKPYERVQLYWKFPEPMDAGNLVKLHNGGIADKLDGDPAVINPGTLMRLGGSIAWPWPSKSKPGRVPELTEFKVLKGRPPTVTPMQVQHAFPFKQETPPTAPPSATLDKPLIQITKADLNPDLRKLVENGLPEGERSEGFHHAVGWLKDGGWDAGQIAEYMAEHPAGIGEKYLSPKDRLLKEVQRSFNKCETEQKEKAEKPRGLRLLTLDELLNRPPPEFLIEDIIPKQGVGILAGQTGSMKTFLAIQLALSVSLGINIGTKTTEKAGSLFLLNEGQAGFGIRCAAWLKHHRVEAPKIFYATDQTPNLMHDTSLDPYKEIVAAAKFNPGFIVIDTFNKASVGGDDNSTSDMALAIETAYKLADHFNAFVLLIDHVGKDARRGIRGAYSKIANVDMAGMVTKAGKQVALKTTKQKEGEDNLTFDFSVNIVEVVHPQTGEILNVPALAAIRSSLQMPQKDFIVSRIDLAGPISREQMAKEFTDRYGAKKSFNTQLGRLVEMGKIKEADGVLTAP